MSGTGLIVRKSAYGYAETLERLTSAIAAHGATVFTVIDHAENAAAVGLEMPPTSVIIFGNPKVGTLAMQAAPDLAVELPSRVLVRTTTTGVVEVVHVDPLVLVERYTLGAHEVSGLAGLTHIVEEALG